MLLAQWYRVAKFATSIEFETDYRNYRTIRDINFVCQHQEARAKGKLSGVHTAAWI
jgi:hypothetical protein